MFEYKDLLMLKLSEITQWNGNEMIIPKSIIYKSSYTYIFGDKYTCEFVDLNKRIYIIRCYYNNGNKYYEQEYQNEQLNGKNIGWWENGNIQWKQKFDNGTLRENIWWWKNGHKIILDEV